MTSLDTRATRTQIAEKLAELQLRLTPRYQWETFTMSTKSKAKDFAQNLQHQAQDAARQTLDLGRKNANLLAVGAGILAFGTLATLLKRKSDTGSSFARAKDKISSAAHTAAQSVATTYDNTKALAEDTYERARDQFTNTSDTVGHYAREKASAAKEAATHAYESSVTTIEESTRSNPLTALLIATLAGAALALALPRTQREDKFMGQERDKLAEKTRNALNAAKSAGAEIAAKSHIGDTAKELLTPLKEAALESLNAAKNAAGESLNPKPVSPPFTLPNAVN